MHARTTFVALALVALTGCGKSGSGSGTTPPGNGDGAAAAATAPAFRLAWSEYPSWSVFGVAHDAGLIDGAEGRQGPIEKAHGVDIVLEQADYDTCITLYAGGSVDAVCITNMDVLNPALSRTSTAILPTSRSHGGDACLVVGIDDVAQLQGEKTYGLARSVSEYAFVRCLEEMGLDPKKFEFVNMDPQAAATAMQQGDASIRSIMVWNPFVMQTLQSRPESKRLFDSSSIPGEIVDMVVCGQDSLDRPHGADFARAVCAAYYAVCDMLADPAKENATLVALGAKFSNLDAGAMREVCKQTLFYASPAQGRDLFGSTEFHAVMGRVVGFCLDRGIVDRKPRVAFNANDAEGVLRFDPQYMLAKP